MAGAARIAFVRTGGESLDSEIWVANRSGRGRRRLIRFSHAAADEPAWSPSGRLAFTVDHEPPSAGQLEIYTARADGSRIHRLTRAGRTEATNPAWSPEGHTIAITEYTRGGLRRLGVFIMRADGRRRHRLTRNRCDYDPAWSPSGGQLVLSRCGSLFVVHADGTHPRRLTTPPPGSQDEQPAWAPNGRLIAFVRIDDGDRSSLYVIHSDGSLERQLTDAGDELSPTWSPDSKLVAYVSYTRIETVAVTTRQTRMLVSMPGSDLASPAWRR
jgi:TolB protein